MRASALGWRAEGARQGQRTGGNATHWAHPGIRLSGRILVFFFNFPNLIAQGGSCVICTGEKGSGVWRVEVTLRVSRGQKSPKEGTPKTGPPQPLQVQQEDSMGRVEASQSGHGGSLHRRRSSPSDKGAARSTPYRLCVTQQQAIPSFVGFTLSFCLFPVLRVRSGPSTPGLACPKWPGSRGCCWLDLCHHLGSSPAVRTQVCECGERSASLSLGRL